MDASDIKVRIIAENDNIIDGLKATADALDEAKKKSEEMNAQVLSANVNAAEANVARLKSMVDLCAVRLKAAQSETEAARKSVEDARAAAEAAKNQVKTAKTDRQREKAQTRAAKAEQRMAAAEAALAVSETKQAQATAQMAQAEARLERAASRAEIAKLEAAHARLETQRAKQMASAATALPAGTMPTGGNIKIFSGDGLFSGLLGGLAKANLAAQAVLGVLREVKEVAAAIVMPGFELTKELETAQLGIAGILQSMGEMDGQAIEFKTALAISDDIVQKLNADAIRTAASTKELVTTFQGLLAPGLDAGMNPEQIRRFTTTGVNFAKAMGLNSMQFVQELRDLLQGGIQPASSQLANALGLTDADIKQARSSADGLFKFLMNRMGGVEDMANEFPKTLAGILSQIDEFSQLASKGIMDDYGGEIKFFLNEIKDLFGTVNEETGNFEVNPAILDFIDALGEIYIWLLEVYDGLVNLWYALADTEGMEGFIGLGGDLLVVLGYLVDFVGQLVRVIGQLFRNFLNSEPIVTAIDLFRKLANELAYLFKIAGIGLGGLAGDMEAANDKQTGKSTPHSGAAEKARQRLKTNQEQFEEWKEKEADLEKIAAKFRRVDKDQQREAIRASKDALRQEIALLKAALDEQLEAYKNHLESIALSFKQNMTGWQEMSLAEAQTKVDEEQAKVDQLTAQLAATEKAMYQSDEEREAAVSAVQIALEKEQRALDKATAGLDDVKRVISEVKARPSAMGQGASAATGTATELGEAVAEAGKKLVDSGVTYKELVCTQLVAKSWDAVGLEEALQKKGIDTTGDGGNDMRDWVPALYEVAERLGALHFPGDGYVPKAGDAGIVYGQNHAFMFTGANTGINSSGRNGGDTPANYVDDVEAAYGGELDAIVDFQKLCIAAGLESAENLRSNNALLSDQIKATTEAGYEALQKAKQSEKEAQGVLKDYSAIIGDVFSIPAEELKQQYEVLRQKLAANAPADKKEELLAALDKVLKNKLIGLKIEQTVKNLDYALEALRDDAERYTAGIANGLLDSHEAFEKYTQAHSGALTAILDDLHRQLEAAIEESNLEQQKNVRAKIKNIRQELQSIFDSFIAAIDKDAEWRSNMVEANWRMTNSQRKYAKDGIERERHAKTAKEERAEAEDKRRRIGKNLNMLEGIKDSQMRREIEKEILSLQNQEIDLTRLARYHEELAYLKTELEEVGVVAKQSLEDNLVTFLTDGINEAENLADALRDLVTGVLKDLQRYFAENITRNLMDSWFPAMDNMQGMQGDAMETQVAGAEMQLQSLLGTSQEFVAGFSSQMQELSMNLDMVFQEIVTAARNASTAVMSMAGSISSAGSSSGAGYADGGFITGPGTGTSDSIHAMLSNGEFVVKAEAVKRYGLAVLERINNGTWGNMVVSVPKFAGGGLVGDAGAAIAEKFIVGASAPSVTTQVNNYVDGRRIFDSYAKAFIRSEVRQQAMTDAKRNSLITRRMR